MGWGSWSITLKGEPDDTTPGSIWEILDPATNAYGHVLITPVRVDPEAVGDAGMLSVAKYAGIYRGNSSRNQIGGIGLVGWLGDEDDKGAIAETAKTGGAGSFANWIDDVIPDALTVGTVTAIAGTLTESMQYMSPRAMLARVMDYFGGVYRVNPDFTLDAGTEANLFDTTPTVLLKYNASGSDGLIRGVRASKIDLSRDLEDYTTRVVMLAEGSGSAVATGAANISPATSFVDGLGNAVVFKRLINAPDVSSGNANTLAAAQLGRFNDLRKSYSLSTSEWGVIFGDVKRLEPGDYIWVYDPRPDAALYDVANEITFHGETLMPVSMRLEAITWPVQEGMGVYFRYWNGTAFTTVDLSNHIVYETGESTLDVGAAQRRLTTDPTPAAVQARVTAAGVLGYAEVTANQSSITTEVALTGLTSTVTVAQGRRVKITGSIRVGSSVVDDVVTMRIKEDGTTVQTAEINIDSRTTAAINQSLERSVVETPTAGSHTYTITLALGGGSGSLTMVASSTSPAFILVEDIGPA
jgi:hypothetical protein